VKAHDGSLLTPKTVVAALSAANSGWRVHLLNDDVVVESDSPIPNLPDELARSRYAVAGRSADGAPVGTGPFRVTAFQSGKQLSLRANEEYWAGRPYLDGVEISFGRNLRDQGIDLQADRADVIEIAVDQVRRAAPEDGRIVLSPPVELLALVFAPAVKDARLRELVSASINRDSIHAVLLQKQGEPAGGLLPQWVSGYAFLFPTVRNEQRLQQSRSGGTQQALTLAYDWSDPVAKGVAERVSVNAQDAGIAIKVFGENLWARQPNSDMRLVRIALPSLQPSTALAAMSAALGHKEQEAPIAATTAPGALYAAERGLLQECVVVPLAYVPQAYVVSRRVQNWASPRQGGWALDSVSLAVERP
jgi:MarR-like DNA-binding transcriptional regulator SgrR of sgrS sRNA